MKSGFLYSSLVDWLSGGNIFQYFSMNETLRKNLAAEIALHTEYNGEAESHLTPCYGYKTFVEI